MEGPGAWLASYPQWVDPLLDIGVHPTLPPPAVVEACYAGVPDHVSFALSTVGWGWHANTATDVLRLILHKLWGEASPPGVQTGSWRSTAGFTSIRRRQLRDFLTAWPPDRRSRTSYL